MDKKLLLPEIEKIKIRHPRAADFMAKISRHDDCFALNNDPKSEDCLRCILRVEYDGQEMSMSECCKKFMKMSVTEKPKGEPVAEKKEEKAKDAPAENAAAAEKPAEKTEAAPKEEKKEQPKPPAKKAAAPKAEKKAPEPAAPKAEKKPPAKKAAAPRAEKKAPVKKADKNSVEGLGSCQLTILNMVKKKSMTQGDIADKLKIKGPTANIALGKLMKKGFITRVPEGRGFLYSSK